MNKFYRGLITETITVMAVLYFIISIFSKIWNPLQWDGYILLGSIVAIVFSIFIYCNNYNEYK